MARIVFTPHLARHLTCPPMQADGATVRDVLAAVFDAHPAVRSYLLDDQGALRKHVMVFVDGAQLTDRRAQSDAIAPEAEIYVMQALSGG